MYAYNGIKTKLKYMQMGTDTTCTTRQNNKNIHQYKRKVLKRLKTRNLLGF